MTPAEVTAYHEAGHAIAYRHFGNRIRSVELFDAGGGFTCGHCWASQDTPLRKAMRSLSGPASEYVATGTVDRDHCRTDLENAARYARDGGIRLDDVWPEALALVDRYQHDIETVAEELLRRGRLDGAAILRLIGPPRTPYRFRDATSWQSPRWAAG